MIMVEVIGLDEKDIDKATLDSNGMPVRAPRDMKAGESALFYMGPAEEKTCVCSECGRPHKVNRIDPRPPEGLQLIVDTKKYDAALLKAKENLREMTE